MLVRAAFPVSLVVLALFLAIGFGACAMPDGSGSAAPVLRVGTSGDYAPFSETSPDGTRRGFDVDVARAFARDTGMRLSWVPFRWPELLGSLDANRFDVAMSGVTVRPERSVEGRFTLPVARTGAVVLVPAVLRARLGAENPISSLDRDGRRIAVNAGGHLERVTRRRFRKAEVIAIPDNGAVPGALRSGQVDAVVTDTLEASRWLAELPGCERVGPFTQDWKAYWVRAEDAALAQRFDDWLIAQEASGRLAGWRSTWFGAAEVPATATPRLALRAAEEERLALMPFVAGIKRAKGLAVVDRAREQRVLDAAWTAVQAAARELALETPSRVEVESFYRRQIEAAVALQEEVIEAPEDSSLARFDLAGELRPALLRIGDRMARLLVRVANEAPGSAGSPDARGARMMEP